MIQLNVNPLMEIELERRLEEIRKEAAQNRVAYQAKKKDTLRAARRTPLMARIGKGLSALGSSLETRYSEPTSGCSEARQFEYS